jgi:hypothetical protein
MSMSLEADEKISKAYIKLRNLLHETDKSTYQHWAYNVEGCYPAGHGRDTDDLLFHGHIYYNPNWAYHASEDEIYETMVQKWNGYYGQSIVKSLSLPYNDTYAATHSCGGYVRVETRKTQVVKWAPAAEIREKGLAEAHYDANAFFMPEGEVIELYQPAEPKPYEEEEIPF